MSQVTAQTTPPSSGGGHEAIVTAALKEISHIATLPEVTMKIISLVEDPDSTAQDLNSVISNDPALGARILKVVNSAFYGLPGQIGSTNRAIVLLGLNAVKNIAIAASLAKLFRGGQITPTFTAKELWQHCIAVATTTRILATKTGSGLPDEAFLAGLIHDIGIMVEIQARRTLFIKALNAKEQDPALSFRQAETDALGANHEQFGFGLCKQWKFPATFAYVAGYHHRPMEVADQHRRLTGLVHVADVLSARLGLGFGGTVDTDTIQTELLQQLNLTQETIDEVSAQVPEAVQEASTLLHDQGG